MRSLSVAPSSVVDNTVEHTVNRTASAAHHVVDTLADQALAGVGNASGSLHVAVNHAADAVSHTADWVAQVPAQMRQKRIKLAKAAFATISARPFVTLGSAIAIGYIIGHMPRRWPNPAADSRERDNESMTKSTATAIADATRSIVTATTREFDIPRTPRASTGATRADAWRIPR